MDTSANEAQRGGSAVAAARLQDPQLRADFAPVPGLWAEVQHSLKNFQALGYFARTDREMFFR
jgi:hypothetical protein